MLFKLHVLISTGLACNFNLHWEVQNLISCFHVSLLYIFLCVLHTGYCAIQRHTKLSNECSHVYSKCLLLCLIIHMYAQRSQSKEHIPHEALAISTGLRSWLHQLSKITQLQKIIHNTKNCSPKVFLKSTLLKQNCYYKILIMHK